MNDLSPTHQPTLEYSQYMRLDTRPLLRAIAWPILFVACSRMLRLAPFLARVFPAGFNLSPVQSPHKFEDVADIITVCCGVWLVVVAAALMTGRLAAAGWLRLTECIMLGVLLCRATAAAYSIGQYVRLSSYAWSMLLPISAELGFPLAILLWLPRKNLLSSDLGQRLAIALCISGSLVGLGRALTSFSVLTRSLEATLYELLFYFSADWRQTAMTFVWVGLLMTGILMTVTCLQAIWNPSVIISRLRWSEPLMIGIVLFQTSLQNHGYSMRQWADRWIILTLINTWLKWWQLLVFPMFVIVMTNSLAKGRDRASQLNADGTGYSAANP